MWADDTYSLKFVQEPLLLRASAVVVQAFYVVLLALTVRSLLRMLRRPHHAAFVLLLFLAGLFALHTFLEVQSRYHFIAVPILILLASLESAKQAGEQSPADNLL
jgi:hypothetical protein